MSETHQLVKATQSNAESTLNLVKVTKWLVIFTAVFGIINFCVMSIKTLKNRNVEIGRYQLFQGYYKSNTVLDKSNLIKEEEQNLFKIDTKTGDVWEYYNFLSSQKSISKWLPVNREHIMGQ